MSSDGVMVFLDDVLVQHAGWLRANTELSIHTDLRPTYVVGDAKLLNRAVAALIQHARCNARNCQYLWIGLFQATSVPVDSVGAESADGVMSVGRSSSLPLWKIAPARTRATRCGALTARQRACAASISL